MSEISVFTENKSYLNVSFIDREIKYCKLKPLIFLLSKYKDRCIFIEFKVG